MSLNVIEVGLNDIEARARYDRLFEECPDAFIQQSTYWAETTLDLYPRQDKPIFLICEQDGKDVAGFPLYLYEHPLGNAISSVPHAGPLGGIFHRQNLDSAAIASIYAALVGAAVRIAERHQCLSLTVITNPFQDDSELYLPLLCPTYIYKNFTQYTDLTTFMSSDDKVAWPDYNRRSNLSRNLKRASSVGFTVKPCETAAELSELYNIHVLRHQELNATPLPFRLFENIFRILVPKDKALILLVKDGSSIASGCLYIQHKHVMDVLRLNMNSDYSEKGPNFVNTDHSIKWAHRKGIRTYNWQSAISRGSGVYRYKQQWGAKEVPYYFLTRLFCEPERIARIGKDALISEYPFHFVVPYGVFDTAFSQKQFEK